RSVDAVVGLVNQAAWVGNKERNPLFKYNAAEIDQTRVPSNLLFNAITCGDDDDSALNAATKWRRRYAERTNEGVILHLKMTIGDIAKSDNPKIERTPD